MENKDNLDNSIEQLEKDIEKSENEYFTKVSKILKDKYNLKIKPKKIEDFLDKKKNSKINEYIQRIFLIEDTPDIKNHLKIIEYGEDSVLNYKNVYEYDKKSWEFQSSHETMTFQKEYKHLYLTEDWMNWTQKSFDFSKKETFHHGSLMSARSYIFDKISAKLDKTLDSIIPRLLITTTSPCENSKNTCMHFESRCAGLEEEHDIATKHLYSVLYEEINIDINKRLEIYEKYTFTNSRDGFHNELYTQLIFGGIKAAKEVSFSDFFIEFGKIEQPIGLLDNLSKELCKKYKFIFKNYLEEIIVKKNMQEQ